MLEHLDREHVSDREHAKELVLEIDARYLGGYPAFNQPVEGSLSLYSLPQSKVVFNSVKSAFEIPIGKIRRAIASSEKGGAGPEDQVFEIDFEDPSGSDLTVAFDHSDHLSDFANELLNLRVNMKSREETFMPKTAKGSRKLRCPYCKFTYSKKLDKCPHCGAMHP